MPRPPLPRMLWALAALALVAGTGRTAWSQDWLAHLRWCESDCGVVSDCAAEWPQLGLPDPADMACPRGTLIVRARETVVTDEAAAFRMVLACQCHSADAQGSLQGNREHVIAWLNGGGTRMKSSAPAMGPPGSNAADGMRPLGGPDIDAYCQQRQLGNGVLSRPRIGERAAFDNWVCRGASDQRVDVDDVCRSQFGSGKPVVAKAENPDDAYTWRCFAATP